MIFQLALVNPTRDQEYINAFGNHLRELRKKHNLSQEQLAANSKLAFSQIGRFERGERSPTLSTIKALADGLGVHPRELLDF